MAQREMISTRVAIDADLWAKFKALSAIMRQSVTELLATAIEEYIERNNRK